MFKKSKEQRVEVLIDVQNLYYSARNLYGAKVNFDAILKKAISGRKFVRAFAYVVRTKTGEEKPFFEALTKLGIETRIRDLQEFYGGAKKADWDVGSPYRRPADEAGITVDAIRTSTNIDVVILCSDDGDFAPLVEYLKNQGKRVEIIAFGRTASSKIKEAADEFFDLEQSPRKFLFLK